MLPKLPALVETLLAGQNEEEQQALNELKRRLLHVHLIDGYTFWHSVGVAQLAHRMGSGLGLEHQDLVVLTKGAFFHDAGKIMIDRDILYKRGTLTESEMAVMKKHPEYGVQLLGAIAGFRPGLAIVGSHHERFDGQGYPQGLAGEAIDYFARLVSIADAYEAMTAERPYRKALSRKAALHELESGSGTQFDASLVEMFLKIIA